MRTLLVLALVACTPRATTQPERRPPPPTTTATSGPPFPRIASYRIETTMRADAVTMLTKIPLAIVDVEVNALLPGDLGAIRAANPQLDLLAYMTSEEIPRTPDPKEHPLADGRFSTIPSSYWLLAPGSVTITPTSPTTTRIEVADPKAFSTRLPRSDFYGPDEPVYLLVGDEHVKLVGIDGNQLIVERGYRSTATVHPMGTSIAQHVVFFADTWMLDLTSGWRDMLAELSASFVATGPWTGVFLDVCFEDISFLNGGKLDLDRDSVPDDPKVASAEWKAAFGRLLRQLRTKLGPDVPIVANPGAQDCPHAELDGILLEGFPIGLPPSYLSFDVGFSRYLRWTTRPNRRPLSIANAYSPKIGFGMIKPGQNELAQTDYAAMRFGLTVALMGDGYYTFDNGVFGHYVAWWYDEYDGAGRGVGWLGYPEGPPRIVGGALVRTFTNGLVIANPTAGPVSVPVPPGYRKLAGRQDPRHNDGAPVTGSLVVAAKDGYVLAR